ncbi:MAG: hypothetical protein QME48_03550 [bacterium]|uniref:Phosphomannomutase n=2 Tax=Bacteria candidate phyla TaxID=1783234 RepID=A0A101I3I6_UNCT6|nr:MAG: phosphomannomutase [candidate division TA06 bacterium 32_111]KUK87553.1 MAG: phosphomannomutase [candidate division TA06 bacterium 34_109]MDI6700287.1 hypothetical protein [bacterium]HAF08112.1 hypothetical protein [candidate division WOR-3 bacterium]HCP16674.1 hypothetical protein [candidate division WOR-3 bacterium]
MGLIRSVSGIRGLVGKDLNNVNVAHFASIFADFIGKGTVIGGRDTRKSGEILSDIFLKSLNFKGIDTIFCGIVPTPTILFLVRKLNLAGGFIITASHNPKEYNGIKFVSSSGRFLNKKDYITFLNYEQNPLPFKENYKKNICDLNLYKKHIKAVLSIPFINKSKIKKRKLRVVFDGGSGAGSIIIPELLENLGVKLHTINTNTDGKFKRNLEPVPENLKGLVKEVKNRKADIGFATDGDGDRIAIVTPQRGAVSEEYTITISGLYALSKLKTKKIVINQSTSAMLEILSKKNNFKVLRAPVGEANVVDSILLNRAPIGGEGNGGVILPKLNLTRDALVAITLILGYLSETKQDIDEIIDQLPKLYMVKKKYDINSSAALDRIENEFKGIPFDNSDGLRYIFEDGFLHIRRSGTEPLIRVICEFTTQEKTNEIVKRVEGLL